MGGRADGHGRLQAAPARGGREGAGVPAVEPEGRAPGGGQPADAQMPPSLRRVFHHVQVVHAQALPTRAQRGLAAAGPGALPRGGGRHAHVLRLEGPHGVQQGGARDGRAPLLGKGTSRAVGRGAGALDQVEARGHALREGPLRADRAGCHQGPRSDQAHPALLPLRAVLRELLPEVPEHAQRRLDRREPRLGHGGPHVQRRAQRLAAGLWRQRRHAALAVGAPVVARLGQLAAGGHVAPAQLQHDLGGFLRRADLEEVAQHRPALATAAEPRLPSARLKTCGILLPEPRRA
mmetsp:Transcript_45163/g.127750  ORF Transcript_45163/g.127750 Transcript_45163/m.127750 type:complete len:292 (+) Transcript_45163:365-1240(+)